MVSSSSSSSSSSSFSLLALLVVFLISQTTLYVKSDETLISQLCNKTVDPVICLDCLNSDPLSKTADAKSLAMKAVSCAKNDTITMFESISNLSERIPIDSPLQPIFSDCVSSTSIIAQLFDGVVFSINKQDYASAKEITLDFVMPISNSCFSEFHRQPNVAVPLDVLSKTRTVNKAVKVMMGILDNI